MGDSWITVEQWRNDTDGETKVYGEKPVPLPLSTTNSTCQGSNPGLHSERLVHDRLSLATVTVEYCKILTIIRKAMKHVRAGRVLIQIWTRHFLINKLINHKQVCHMFRCHPGYGYLSTASLNAWPWNYMKNWKEIFSSNSIGLGGEWIILF